jgi:hypothetical protein
VVTFVVVGATVGAVVDAATAALVVDVTFEVVEALVVVVTVVEGAVVGGEVVVTPCAVVVTSTGAVADESGDAIVVAVSDGEGPSDPPIRDVVVGLVVELASDRIADRFAPR